VVHAHTSQREWIVDFGCLHHMAMHVSLFSCLSEAEQENIFVSYDYALIVINSGRVDCENGMIIDVYHVPHLGEIFLSVPQLTKIGKKVEFYPKTFVVKDINIHFEVFMEVTTNPRTDCIIFVTLRVQRKDYNHFHLWSK
jgi:hypothetical protein